MRRITPSFVACPVLQHIPHYLTNGTVFDKKKKKKNRE
jgi:hypothetical protein